MNNQNLCMKVKLLAVSFFKAQAFPSAFLGQHTGRESNHTAQTKRSPIKQLGDLLALVPNPKAIGPRA
ncbi:hypothetical protein BCT59_09910 [Vibrio breoganii]|nr:hypothetical protein BCT59_09910 [Vibrio breoganii]